MEMDNREQRDEAAAARSGIVRGRELGAALTADFLNAWSLWRDGIQSLQCVGSSEEWHFWASQNTYTQLDFNVENATLFIQAQKSSFVLTGLMQLHRRKNSFSLGWKPMSLRASAYLPQDFRIWIHANTRCQRKINYIDGTAAPRPSFIKKLSEKTKSWALKTTAHQHGQKIHQSFVMQVKWTIFPQIRDRIALHRKYSIPSFSEQAENICRTDWSLHAVMIF